MGRRNPSPCNLKILGVRAGGYTQLNPKGTVYLQDLEKAKWWGTACHSRVEFNLNRYVPGTETKTAYYNAYSAGSGNTWTARSLLIGLIAPPKISVQTYRPMGS